MSNERMVRPESRPAADDPQAQRERGAAEQQALEADRRRQEHRRQEKLRDVFAFGVRVLLVVVFILLAATLVALAWHYIGSPEYLWIPDDKLETISTVLFSGTLFVFLGLYIRDRV